MNDNNYRDIDDMEQITKSDIDPRTGFIVGSKEYYDYYLPNGKREEKTQTIDEATGFVVGSQEYYDYYLKRIEPGSYNLDLDKIEKHI